MGLMFPVYPPEDLSKLDDQKRKELGNAIRQVLLTDSDVQQLLKDKTWEALQTDRDALNLLKDIDSQKLLKEKTWDTFKLLRDKTLDTLRSDREIQQLLKDKTGVTFRALLPR